MGVIIKNMYTHQSRAFIKGSPEMIQSLCLRSTGIYYLFNLLIKLFVYVVFFYYY